jgi:hypothetical protein
MELFSKLEKGNKIIGIVGSRRRDTETDFRKVKAALGLVYKGGDWICSGGCLKGGDRFAYKLHKIRCIPYLEFPADWKQYRKAAGFIRNSDIAKHSDILIACVAQDRTGGTEDTIQKFKKHHPDGIVVLV